MNPAGSLFDYMKLCDVSKNVISRMTSEQVYKEILEWTSEFDTELYELLKADEQKALAILSIGRGGNKPRKDIGTWSEIRAYLGFFYDPLFSKVDAMPENVSKEDTLEILKRYCDIYDPADDSTVWFEKITKLSTDLGFAAKPKEYKANPEAFKGHVGDISMVLRIAVTGKAASPDLCSVMSILGKEKVLERLNLAINELI